VTIASGPHALGSFGQQAPIFGSHLDADRCRSFSP
jgi:hypothetical protein